MRHGLSHLVLVGGRAYVGVAGESGEREAGGVERKRQVSWCVKRSGLWLRTLTSVRSVYTNRLTNSRLLLTSVRTGNGRCHR